MAAHIDQHLPVFVRFQRQRRGEQDKEIPDGQGGGAALPRHQGAPGQVHRTQGAGRDDHHQQQWQHDTEDRYVTGRCCKGLIRICWPPLADPSEQRARVCPHRPRNQPKPLRRTPSISRNPILYVCLFSPPTVTAS